MAVTHEVQTPEGLQGRLGSAEHHLQLADTTCYKGTLVMQVDGKFQPAASGVEDSKLLGIAEKTYATSVAGEDQEYATDDPAVFGRGTFGLPGDPDDLPTDAEVGSDVYIADNYSVKKTMATDDMAVKLVAISPPSINSSSSARLYFVEIK